MVRRHAGRVAQRTARQAWRRLAHPRCDRPCPRRRDRASCDVRQGTARPDGRRHGDRADRQRDHHLHEREFRARQGTPARHRPQADGRRVAGAVGHHGQGRRRGALSQRGRGPHPLHRAAAAGTDQCPAGGPSGAQERHRRQDRQGRGCRDRAARRLHRRVRRTPRADPADPVARPARAAGPAGAPEVESGLLARPELVDRGPVLVSPCNPGHGDLSGPLFVVHGAGAAGPSAVGPARHVCRQRLPGKVRLHPEPEDRAHG